MKEQNLPEDFEIRPGTPDDASLILSFIKELADYEKMSDEVVADENLINEHLFGKRKSAEVVIGYYKNEPVGFALFFHNFSTFLGRPGLYLEDLFVRKEMRGKGFGKALLKHLAHLAVKRNCGRMEWAVLNWNEPSIQFYKSLGAKPMDDWTVYRVTGKALKELGS
ncbi:MAG TPA: GNAT family N-acetyltransferase [Balneolales bacterium]|nr:GNAT family N-acetyltransferase [Balneolales bacterium]